MRRAENAQIQLTLEGTIKRKQGMSIKKKSRLRNIRNWIKTGVLFTLIYQAQDKYQFAIISDNLNINGPKRRKRRKLLLLLLESFEVNLYKSEPQSCKKCILIKNIYITHVVLFNNFFHWTGTP